MNIGGFGSHVSFFRIGSPVPVELRNFLFPLLTANCVESLEFLAEKKSIVPVEQIKQSILMIRGRKVMLDADLSSLYKVPTKALNPTVKRNIDRDCMFQLTKEEKAKVVTLCGHLLRKFPNSTEALTTSVRTSPD